MTELCEKVSTRVRRGGVFVRAEGEVYRGGEGRRKTNKGELLGREKRGNVEHKKIYKIK